MVTQAVRLKELQCQRKGLIKKIKKTENNILSGGSRIENPLLYIKPYCTVLKIKRFE
jgi:hypothetical protein